MKKITLLFTFLIAFGYSTYAQVSAYSFSTNTTGTLDPMTGSTQLIGSGSDDGVSAVTPIGFAFTYAGTVYNNFSVNANGLVRLGTTVVTNQWTNSAANANTASPAIFPYWDDLATGSAAGGGKVHYLITGSAPNQKLIIEWFVTVPRNTTGAANARFQCVLEETTNIVSFVYGGGMVANSGGASIGLATSTTVYNTVTASTNTNTTSSFVTNNTGAITSGTSYIFTPPTPCSGAPVAGTVSPVTQTLLTGQTPAALIASGYSSGVSGITFQWQESDDDGATDAWANAVGGTGATTASYTPPVYSGTPIYYRLVVTCTNSTMSANTASVMLTGCSTVTSFTETFDAVTTPAFPGCWAKIGTLGSASTQTGSPNSAPNTLYMYGSSGTAQPVVAMQPVSNLGAGTHRLRFNMRANFTANGVIEFGYLTNPTDATTFVSLGSATAATLTYAEYIITPTAGSYSNFPALRHTGVPANSLLIDDVKWEVIPACLAPNTLSAANITATSADLSWIDGSGGSQFDYEYVVQAQGTGMPAGAGTPLDISSFPLPVNVSSLTPNTPYEFWVRANCGGSGYSTWAGPYNFRTMCNPYTVPYFEGFESGYTHNTSITGCLTQESVTGTAVWTANTSLTTYNRTPRTGSWNAFLQYGNDDWIFIPIDLTGGTSYTVDLYARQDGATATNSDITISYGSSANAAGMTNSIVAATGIVNGNYQQIAGNFTPATTGTYYVGIKGYMNGTPWYISLDDISIIETPACQAPIGLAVSNITDVAADVTWTASTGNYEYVLDMVATDPAGSGTPLATESYNASGLSPLTTYYFHVRSVCAGPTYSAWSTVSFTTLATPPANDNCSAAQVLTPGGVFADNAVVGTNVGATDSGETAPGCSLYSGGDVWYQVTVPASGNITIETDTNTGTTITDTGMAVYSGACGSLTVVGCDDDAGNGFFSLVSLTGRTPGEVLYINVFEYGNDTFNTFQVSAYDASLSSNSFDSNAFLAYPNPVKDVLNLEYNSEISTVRVMNLLGQEVITRNVNANSTQVDMSQLNAGAYIVNVTIGNAVKTIKVVKQ